VKFLISKEGNKVEYLMAGGFWLGKEAAVRSRFINGIDFETNFDFMRRNHASVDEMFTDLSCQLYVQWNEEIEALFAELIEITSLQQICSQTLRNGFISISVIPNKWQDARKHEENPNEYVYYNHLLEIYCEQEELCKEYVALIGDLLETLWDRDIMAIACSNFEKVLPYQGGYGYR